MESYDTGVLVGKIITWLILALILWGFYRVWKKIFTELFHGMWALYGYFFPNPTKKLLKTYLFWVDFVQGISSTDAFKTKLATIAHVKVYKNGYGGFFLTKEEALSQNEHVEEVTIKELLASETYPLFLLTRLESITLYDKDDLKNITRSSQMVWTSVKEILFHMIMDKEKLMYPNDYSLDNPFRFGYQIFYDANALMGLYDVEAERFVLPFEYKYMSNFANIAEVSKDEINYEIWDLQTQTKLSSSTTKTFPNLSSELKKQINLSKIELKDYLKLLPAPKSQHDLMQMGLWDAKVWVMEVPSVFEEIIEDSNFGTIEWNQYGSADIFDMSIELPVNFKKKNGEYVSVGIKHEYLALDAQYRQRLNKLENLFENTFEDLLKRGNLPDDPRVVPNYLKIKNAQYNDVDFSNNRVDEIIKLTSDEFNELVSNSDSGLLFTYLSTLSEEELEKFYDYNDKVVKLADGAEMSAREQFESAMASIDMSEITDEQRARATLEMPLVINYAKEFYSKTITFKMFRTYAYFKDYEDEKDARFEVTLSNIIWDEMKYIPEYFEQVLTLYRDAYDANSEYHQKIFEHLTKRFGYLIFALDKLMQLVENKTDTSLHWFVVEASDRGLLSTKIEMSVDAIHTLQSDKKLIDFLTLMFVSICAQDDNAYLESLVNVTKSLFEWYPANSEACEYAMVEMMKSVALKEVNANAFISFFEELPRFYEVLSYEKIMQLKELINHTLANYKPLDNKVFEQKGVKNKLILLNYFVDMEDLYYESGKF